MFRRVIQVDENMPVHSEKDINAKFSSSTTLEAMLGAVDKHPDQMFGILKIKTTDRYGNAPPTRIDTIIIVPAEIYVRLLKKSGSYDAINRLKSRSIEGAHVFYACGSCGGYIEGKLIGEHCQDVDGTETQGIEYRCERCGVKLAITAYKA